METGQAVDQAADLDFQLAAHLGALDRRIADRRQALHQVGHAAVIGPEGLVPGARRIGEVAPDVGILHEMAAQLDRAGGEGLGDALLAAGIVVHQPLVDHRRIAQPEGVVERLAVPVGRPLAAEIVDQRVVDTGRPAQLARLFGLARLLLELAVHLGQHQEQRVLLLGAVGRRGADRLVDPRRHHVGEVADFLVAVGNAEQDRRQFALGRVALEEIGDLAAQQELAQRIGALGHALGLGDIAQVGELQPRAGAREVEQVGVVEEVPRLFGDGDAQLRRERADQRARQLGVGRGAAVGLLGPHLQRVLGVGAETVEREHVDDALLARDQRIHAEQRLGREGELLQPVVQRQIKVGEGLEVVPQHRPQPGAVVARQPRRQLDGFAPVIGAQLGGDAGEEGVEILDDVEHVVGIEIAQRRRCRLEAELGQALADGAAVGPLERRLLMIEVEQEGVAQDLDDVGLGQKPHADRKVLVAGAQAQAEAGHQAGQFAIARRVDLAQEVVGLVGEARLQRMAVAAGQDRDQVRLAGLARPEHADAHAPAGGARQLAALVADFLQLADQRRRLLRHGRRLLGRTLQPVDALARGDGQRLAVLGQFEIDRVHVLNRS